MDTFFHIIHNIFIKDILNIFNGWFRYYYYELGYYWYFNGLLLTVRQIDKKLGQELKNKLKTVT